MLLLDTFYVLGTCMFVFKVLPFLDNILQGLGLMAGASLLPSFLQILNSKPTETKKLTCFYYILDILTFIAQLSALVAWPIVSAVRDNQTSDLTWAIPLSLLLISFGWWENYVDQNTKLGRLGEALVRLKKRTRRSKTKTYMIASVWKMILTFIFTLAFISMDYDVNGLFKFTDDDAECKNTVSHLDLGGLTLDWVWVWLTNLGAGIVSYYCARTAAKTHIQPISFALPLLLSTPLLMGLLIGGCSTWNGNPCKYSDIIPSYLFWQCYPQEKLQWVFWDQFGWLMVLWWLSQIWVTKHIWNPKSERLAKTEK